MTFDLFLYLPQTIILLISDLLTQSRNLAHTRTHTHAHTCTYTHSLILYIHPSVNPRDMLQTHQCEQPTALSAHTHTTPGRESCGGPGGEVSTGGHDTHTHSTYT
ncbi:unnamed protein product [Lota lota]